MIFKGRTIDNKPQLLVPWSDVAREAAKHPKFEIEVRNAEPTISDRQRKYLHCKGGPIAFFVDRGLSQQDAKFLLKVHYGRKWFVTVLEEDNFKGAKGYFRWECQTAVCRGLYHPMEVLYIPMVNGDIRRMCPNCDETSIQPVAIKSIMDVSVKNIYLWFNEIFQAHPQIKRPNSDLNPKGK